MPLITPNFIAVGQMMYKKNVTKFFFYTFQYFGAPEEHVPKFTNLGGDE